MGRDELSYVYLFFRDDKVALEKSNHLNGGYGALFPSVGFTFSYEAPRGTFDSGKWCPGESIREVYHVRPLMLMSVCDLRLERKDRRGRISDDIEIEVIAGELPDDSSALGELELEWVNAEELDRLAEKEHGLSDLAGVLAARRLLSVGWYLVVDSADGRPIGEDETLKSCGSRVKPRWGGTVPMWRALSKIRWHLALSAEEYDKQIEEYYKSLEDDDESAKAAPPAIFDRDGRQLRDFDKEIEARLYESLAESEEALRYFNGGEGFESDTLLGILCDMLTDFACSEDGPYAPPDPDEGAGLYDAKRSAKWLRGAGLLDADLSADIMSALEYPDQADEETLDSIISQVALYFSSRGEWSKRQADEYLRQALKLRSKSQAD